MRCPLLIWDLNASNEVGIYTTQSAYQLIFDGSESKREIMRSSRDLKGEHAVHRRSLKSKSRTLLRREREKRDSTKCEEIAALAKRTERSLRNMGV